MVRDDVQGLLQEVIFRPVDELSARFPEKLPSRSTLRLKGGEVLRREKRGFEGLFRTPMSWECVMRKLDRLASPFADQDFRRALADVVANLEDASGRDLTAHLERIGWPTRPQAEGHVRQRGV